MANSSGLKDRPSRTSWRGVATLYQGSINASSGAEFLSAKESERACARAGQALLLGEPRATAHPSSPGSVDQPRTPPEALALLRSESAERYSAVARSTLRCHAFWEMACPDRQGTPSDISRRIAAVLRSSSAFATHSAATRSVLSAPGIKNFSLPDRGILDGPYNVLAPGEILGCGHDDVLGDSDIVQSDPDFDLFPVLRAFNQRHDQQIHVAVGPSLPAGMRPA